MIIGCRRGDRGIDVLHVYNGRMPVCFFVWCLVSAIGTGAFSCLFGWFCFNLYHISGVLQNPVQITKFTLVHLSGGGVGRVCSHFMHVLHAFGSRIADGSIGGFWVQAPMVPCLLLHDWV